MQHFVSFFFQEHLFVSRGGKLLSARSWHISCWFTLKNDIYTARACVLKHGAGNVWPGSSNSRTFGMNLNIGVQIPLSGFTSILSEKLWHFLKDIRPWVENECNWLCKVHNSKLDFTNIYSCLLYISMNIYIYIYLHANIYIHTCMLTYGWFDYVYKFIFHKYVFHYRMFLANLMIQCLSTCSRESICLLIALCLYAIIVFSVVHLRQKLPL